MNRVKFKVEIASFKIEYEGSREDMKQMPTIFGQQVSGLVQSGISPASGQLQITEKGEATVISNAVKKARGRRSKSNSSAPQTKESSDISLVYDGTSYGLPNQKWTALDKGLWVLFIVEKINSINDLSAGQVAETFNSHFREHGKIRSANISRDFGFKKSGSTALVGADEGNPVKWYLTETGKTYVQSLISNPK